jgi:undecaprenyl diphosphate synthase
MFKDIFKKPDKEDIITFKLPRHIALTTKGKHIYAEKHKFPIEQVYKKSNAIVLNTLTSLVKLKVPITTFYILSTKSEELEHFSKLITSLTEFLNELALNSFIHENKVKISIIGKWYDLPGKFVDAIKNLIEKTKDYDGYFVNFCINYNGQEEIIDAIKLIARQIKAEKIDAEMITNDLIKESIYSSYFLPPDLIVINGSKKTSDLLLWDSPDTKVYFTNKLWPDFDKGELMDAVKEYQKS